MSLFQYIETNKSVSKYPSIKHTGKVITETARTEKAVFLFTFSRSETPAPMTEQAFILLVLTGKPSREEKKRDTEAHASETNPRLKSSFTVFSPRDFIILPPPSDVPIAITVETVRISDTGTENPTLPSPKLIRKSITPINFCPSCAPCINEVVTHDKT